MGRCKKYCQTMKNGEMQKILSDNKKWGDAKNIVRQ